MGIGCCRSSRSLIKYKGFLKIFKAKWRQGVAHIFLTKRSWRAQKFCGRTRAPPQGKHQQKNNFSTARATNNNIRNLSLAAAATKHDGDDQHHDNHHHHCNEAKRRQSSPSSSSSTQHTSSNNNCRTPQNFRVCYCTRRRRTHPYTPSSTFSQRTSRHSSQNFLLPSPQSPQL